MAVNLNQPRFIQPIRSVVGFNTYQAAIDHVNGLITEFSGNPKSDGVSVVARYKDGEVWKMLHAIYSRTDNKFTFFVHDVTDFAELEGRVDSLENLMGEQSVATQITNAINDLDSEKKGEAVYVDVTVKQTDGKLESVVVDETALSAKIESLESADNTLQGNITKEEERAEAAEKILEEKIAAAEKAAKAAATLINEKSEGFVKVSGEQDETTGAWTYTVSESDIASATALTQETSERQQADQKITNDLNTEISDRKAQDDKIEASIGLAEDGSYVKTSGEYTSEATTVVGAIDALDTQVKANADAIDALEGLMGEESVADQITEAIQKLDVTDNAVVNQYVSSVSETDGKIAVERKALVSASDKVLTYTENGITSTIEIKKLSEDEVKALADGNVAEAYKLVGKDSTQLGETIKIYKDQALKNVELSGQTLVFTYTLADGTDKVLSVDVSSFLTESEYGNGLQVIDHVISAKLGEDTESNKNFLDLEGDEEGKKSLVVRSIDTDSTITTDRVLVAGGPLDSTNLRAILPKDDSGNAYIEKGTDIQSLLLSLFTKVEWPTPKITEGKINTTIAAPSFTLANSSKTVEVGTVCTLSEATLTAVSNATTARTCGEFTYGQSTSVNGAITKNKTISINASNIGVNGDNYTMTRDFTGFANTDDSATPSTNAADVKLTSVDCVVVEGTNKVKITVKGPKGTCQFAEMPSYYVTSNIGTLSAEHMSPSKALATVNEDTTPSNSKELSVTGNYRYFLGYSEKTAYNQFDSASVRALTTKTGWTTVNGSTTIVAENAPITSNGKSIVIACPSKYKLASISNGVGADILANFSSVGEVDVTTGSIVTKYKVYVYPITNGAAVEFKKVTLAKA